MKVAVITFPGSNCDRDMRFTFDAMFDGVWGEAFEGDVQAVWHRDSILPNVDVVALPGGFSYGDYLRSGAISARSPIMDAVRAHADRGGYVMGVCNGFQVLTEAGLLPGVLMRNRDLRFICRTTPLKVMQTTSIFTRHYAPEAVISMPVAHHDGNYRINDDGLKELQDNQQIVFSYCDAKGHITDAANMNGSVANIAGIVNVKGNVMGMMPHPERICDPLTGGTDGRGVFQSLYAQAA